MGMILGIYGVDKLMRNLFTNNYFRYLPFFMISVWSYYRNTVCYTQVLFRTHEAEEVNRDATVRPLISHFNKEKRIK